MSDDAINAIDAHHYTPLKYAIRAARLKALKALLLRAPLSISAVHWSLRPNGTTARRSGRSWRGSWWWASALKRGTAKCSDR